MFDKDLGQVMTPVGMAEKMATLKKNTGTVLEPSCGQGVFLRLFPEADGCELMEELVPSDLKSRVTIGDFISTNLDEYDTIIGNPPYVRGKDLNLEATNLVGSKANLYLHFIERCFRLLKPGGELIFIVPTNLFLGGWGSKLRQELFDKGSFTDVWWNVDPGWENANVETCVFRYEKTLGLPCTFNGEIRKVFCSSGFIFFPTFKPVGCLGDIFKATVGAAPKASIKSNSGIAVENFDGSVDHFLEDTSQWPRWKTLPKGEKILVRGGPTRKTTMFRCSEVEVTSAHALIPRRTIDCPSVASELNNWSYWEEMCIRLNGRWSVGPKLLENMPIDSKLKAACSGL